MRVRSFIAAAMLGLVALLGGTGTAWAQEESAEEKKEISHEAEECIHLLEEGKDVDDCHESPSVILPATNEIVWGTISFFLLLLIMWKLALPAIKNLLEARTDRIRENLDESE